MAQLPPPPVYRQGSNKQNLQQDSGQLHVLDEGQRILEDPSSRVYGLSEFRLFIAIIHLILVNV